MSAQPVWVTPPGSLGTISQGVYYQVNPPIRATTSDNTITWTYVDRLIQPIIQGPLAVT